MGCLYSLTSPSGKQYLGITLKSAEKRFAKHVEHALGKRDNGVLYSALRKYKPESFKLQTLVIANDWDYLCDLERKAIHAFKTQHPLGYNMTEGGEGVIGPRDDEFKARVSSAQKIRYSRPEEKARLAVWGKRAREALQARHAKRRIDGRAPWEDRKWRAHARQGSEEHRAKISIGTKAAMARPEVAAKVKRWAVERGANLEWRRKVGESKRGHKYGPRSPEFIAKLVAGIKAAWADPVKKAARIEKNRLARERKK